MLAWGIGNPALELVDSDFPAITRPAAERDYCSTGDRARAPDDLKDKQ